MASESRIWKSRKAKPASQLSHSLDYYEFLTGYGIRILRARSLWREATAKQPPLTELSVQVSYLLFSSTYAQCWLDFVQADLEEIQIVSDRIILALKGRSPHRKRPIQMYLSPENKLVERLREILEIVNDDQKLRGCSPTENLEVQARMREFSGILNRAISERRRAKS